jgi:hypothetical protein
LLSAPHRASTLNRSQVQFCVQHTRKVLFPWFCLCRQSDYVARGGLESLAPPLECWGYRCAPHAPHSL